MTDLSAALADSSSLQSYKGRDVLRTSIAIRRAGDGLSEAMGIDPVELTIGDHVFVVLECVVAHHDYGPIKDTDCLELKQVLNAEGATLVNEELVRKHLDDQADRVKLARESAAGIQRLAVDGFEEADAAEVAINAHRQGVHAEERSDECPLCREEIDAEAEEAAQAEGGPVDIQKGRSRKPRGEA